jgi:hypothetical protein
MAQRQQHELSKDPLAPQRQCAVTDKQFGGTTTKRLKAQPEVPFRSFDLLVLFSCSTNQPATFDAHRNWNPYRGGIRF